MARRKAKKATAAYLERVALWYLSRYPGSIARVTQALNKRVRRSVTELDSDPVVGAANVAAVIAKLQAANLLDDARFARSRIRTMRARGKSARAIAATLRRQGIAAHVTEQALLEVDEHGHCELAAAIEMVRRKRLGWHRSSDEERALYRSKDLGKLARAGFSYAVAQQALVSETARPQR